MGTVFRMEQITLALKAKGRLFAEEGRRTGL